MDRKHFVISSTISAFAALAWIRGAGQLKPLAASAPAGLDIQEVALGIVRAILPFEHPRFPKIDAIDIRRRMYAMFGLDGDARFAATLALFDSVGAWSNPPLSVLDLEMHLYGMPDFAHDAWLFKNWAATVKPVRGKFTDLDAREKRSYLELWAMSAFGVRRRIYQSLKALVNASAYSMDALWEVIGYEGPLVSRQVSS